MITAYHAKYDAHALTRRHSADGVDRLSRSLFDASVDLNPHQIEAALFALRNPLQQGVLLADEVGLAVIEKQKKPTGYNVKQSCLFGSTNQAVLAHGHCSSDPQRIDADAN